MSKKRKTDKRKQQQTANPPADRDVPYASLASSRRFAPADWRNVAIVMGVALTLRTVFFLLSRTNNPLFYNPIMDGLYHHEWAGRILTESFWGDEVFFRAPLYPYVLAAMYKISGSSIAFAIAMQHAMGVASSVLVYLLTRRFFEPRVALVAGLLAALYWPFVYFEGDLLIVTLVVLLDLLALLALTIALQDDRPLFYVIAGVVLGASALARPNVLIFLPAVPVAFRLCKTSSMTWLRRTLLVYVAVVIVIVPVFVRNYVVGHDIVPIASQGGVNFYIGNNPQSDGRTAIVPGTRWDWWGGYEDAIRLAEQEAGRRLRPSEVSNHYFRKGLAFVATSPDRSIPLLLRKLYLFWAGGERSNNKYIYFFWHQSGLGKVPLPGFWLVAPLGLVGGILLWRKDPGLRLLHLFVLSYMVGVVAFFVNARFRLPVVPVLIIFAAYAALYVIEAWRRRRHKALKALFALVVACLIIDGDFVTFKENKVYADAISHYTLGNAYLKMGKVSDAVREYETAVRVNGQYPTPGYRLIARNVDYNLGKLYYDSGNWRQAVTYLERVGGADVFGLRAREYAGDCYLALERPEDAIRLYSQLAGATRDPAALGAAYRGLARANRALGRNDTAREHYRRAIELMPEDASLGAELRALEVDR